MRKNTCLAALLALGACSEGRDTKTTNPDSGTPASGDGADGAGDGGAGDGGDGSGDSGDGGDGGAPTAVLSCSMEGRSLTVDGSASVDPLGEGLRYRWSTLASPAAGLTLDLGTSATDAAVLPLLGSYTVQLIVADRDDQESAPATCEVTRSTTLGLVVELVGTGPSDGDADFDLHLAHSGAGFFAVPGDASWCNASDPGPDGTDRTDDDLVQVSDSRGGPPPDVEVMEVAVPGPVIHTPRVHVYTIADEGSEDVPLGAEVRIWVGGVLTATEVLGAIAQREVWTPGTWDADAGTWTPDASAPEWSSTVSCP